MNPIVSVNIKDLKKLKQLAEDLLYEMSRPNHVNVIADARAEAYNALNQYTESYVRINANAVLKYCDELETVRNWACADLRTEIEGLNKVIDGYLELEHSFM